MRGISMEEFIQCSSAPNYACPRKRRASHLLPQLKRHKLTIFSQQGIVDEDGSIAKNEDGATEELLVEPVDFQDISSALPGKEKRNSYPSVIYDGNVAIVKLGVGQKVMLDGCAMVQVVEGHASMLGYSFPRGTDVLVCSSPENDELSIIEAHHGGVESMDVDMADGSEEACQLRIVSHTLGQNVSTSTVAPQDGNSFELEFVASPVRASRGKKRERQFVDDEEFRGIKRNGPRG